MIEAYKRFLRNYATFDGRSNRSDYWWVVLCNFIIGLALGLLGGLTGDANGGIFSTLAYLYSLATLVPGIAVSVRRLHDINKSGWYLLLGLIPVVGAIIIIIFTLQDSVNEGNQYGTRVH